MSRIRYNHQGLASLAVIFHLETVTKLSLLMAFYIFYWHGNLPVNSQKELIGEPHIFIFLLITLRVSIASKLY